MKRQQSPHSLGLLGILAILPLLSGCPKTVTGGQPSPGGPANLRVVGITQIVEHPMIDLVRTSFLDAMKVKGYHEGKNIRYDFQNAQGDMSNAQKIAQKFSDEKVNAIFSIVTPSSQAVAKSTKTIPIVFGAVTDPIGAGLVKRAKRPGGNITGVSDMLPYEEQVKLLLKVAPATKSLGMIYNSGESNAVFGVEQTQIACKRLGVVLKTAAISSSSEVYSAAQALGPSVDAFYSGSDNTVVSALSALVKAAREAKKPLLAGDTESVKNGALLTVGINYKKVGQTAADMMDRVLQGEKPGDIDVVYLGGETLCINTDAAKSMGVTLPTDLIKQADQIYPRDSSKSN